MDRSVTLHMRNDGVNTAKGDVAEMLRVFILYGEGGSIACEEV